MVPTALIPIASVLFQCYCELCYLGRLNPVQVLFSIALDGCEEAAPLLS